MYPPALVAALHMLDYEENAAADALEPIGLLRLTDQRPAGPRRTISQRCPGSSNPCVEAAELLTAENKATRTFICARARHT